MPGNEPTGVVPGVPRAKYQGNAPLHIRAVTRDEVVLYREWANREGWNPGAHDGTAFHAADPGGFLVGQHAAKAMVESGRGTILFTGATASLRGGANFANLAVGKFGLRALAQSMTRELGPKGIHVGHVIIDGQIRSERYAHLEKERAPDGLLDPAAIAETYWQLHVQPRSAWTLELDLRPWVEKF